MVTAGWAGFIFFLSTRSFGAATTAWLISQALGLMHLAVSAATLDRLDFVVRKLAHLTEYCILAIFLYHALAEEDHPGWRPRRAFACVLLAGLYSLTDEYHQLFVPGRTSSVVDSGIDTTGAFAGMLIFYFTQRFFTPQRTSMESPDRAA